MRDRSMVDQLRTLGIVAHIDAGKTTLTERILFDSGAQRFCGEVDDGTAAMDWMREEQERGISIVAAATSVNWRGCELQIVDTPGHVDFTAEVERCLRVLDGVVVVLDAVRGVESQTTTVWREADRWRAARLVFVNKMDRVGADFATAMRALKEQFGCRPVPVAIPLFDDGGAFAGVGDPLGGSVSWFAGDVPMALHARLANELRAARDVVVEACADVDDSVLADFVAGREIGAEALRRALRRGCIANRLVPALAGAALHGHGVDLLLDAICDLLPSPIDRDREGLEAAFPPAEASAPLCALVFKVEHVDSEVRNYLRVFAGELRRGAIVVDARTGAEAVVDELWAMHASHHRPLEVAGPGAIAVWPGSRDLQTGDTLHGRGHACSLPMPRFSPPVLAAVFEPATPDDVPRLLRALEELQADDPTLVVRRDAGTGLPLVLGMGELHLEIVASRARERSAASFQMARPRVESKATVRRSATARATVAMPGSSAVAAEAEVAVTPLPAGSGLAVDFAAVAGRAGAAALGDAVRQRLEAGGGLPHPATAMRVDVRAVVGDVEPGVASAALLEQAVGIALTKALAAAEVVELEPEVEFEVRCPSEHRHAVLADLLARGVTMRQVSSGQLGALLQGRGLLRAFLGYATRLRSLTRGQGEAQLAPRGLVPHVSEGALPPRI